MPELLEAEMYRSSLAAMIGGTFEAMPVADTLVVPEAGALGDALLGRTLRQVRRHGKVVIIDTDAVTVGVGFGMTGRLIVGDDDPIPQLAYGPGASDDRFDRWVVTVARGRSVAVRLSDPRRLARVRLDPDLSALGPDATQVDATILRQQFTGRRRAVKAVLLDQTVVAGLGNLLADEWLWRSGVAPDRPAASLQDTELVQMAAVLPVMLTELMQRGGSHCGDLAVELRTDGARCPMDGAGLVRRSIGGRTSWSCPLHQR